MNEKKRELPALLFEQLLLGELNEKQQEALRQEFGADALRALVERQREEEATSRARLPPLRAHQHLLFTKPGRRFFWTRFNPLPVAAIGVALLAVLSWPSRGPWGEDGQGAPAITEPRFETPDRVADEGSTRIKGQQPVLLLFRKAGQDVQMLEAGSRASAGDILQLAYVAAGARYGVVASVDGRGAVTIHFPSAETAAAESAGEPTALGSGKVLLEHAYRLDDAPAYERFVFVTSAVPLDVDVVRAVLEAQPVAQVNNGTLPPLPSFGSGQQASSYLLLKSGAP